MTRRSGAAALVLCALAPASVRAEDAAARLARLQEACSSEISLLCGGRSDVATCLEREKRNATESCREAIDGKSFAFVPAPRREAAVAPIAARPAASPARPQAISAAASPLGPSHPVQIDEQYSGKGEQVFPALRDAIKAELPAALRDVSAALGIPQYASGLSHPLSVKFYYDPTAQDGIGYLEEDSSGTDWAQAIKVDVALWEDCPSKPYLRRVFRHEMVHAMLHDYLLEQGGAAVPQWFDEGAAVLVSDGDLPVMLRNEYARHGGSYPRGLNCPLDRPGGQGVGMAVLQECYAYYGTAVGAINEASPGALAKVVIDLRNGASLEDSIQTEAHMSWQAFTDRSDRSIKAAMDKMSYLDYLRGRWLWRIKCGE